jgi:hypothetical protein
MFHIKVVTCIGFIADPNPAFDFSADLELVFYMLREKNNLLQGGNNLRFMVPT